MSEGNSVRDRLRAHREEVRSRSTLELLVPGYGEDLKVRYKLLPEKVTEQIAKKVRAAERQGDNAKALEISADILVKSCDCILVAEGEGFEPLLDDEAQPVRFDATLAEVLGMELGEDPRAVDICIDTFSPKGEDGIRRNPDAISRHVSALGAWRQGRDTEIGQELLGE